jgi:hypothetical protein
LQKTKCKVHFVYAVFDVGLAPVLIDEGIDGALFNSVLVAVKGITGKLHDPTGFGYVARLLGQVQQSDLVFDDGFGAIQHEGYLLKVMMLWVRTFIKTGNPHFFKCGVRSNRN